MGYGAYSHEAHLAMTTARQGAPTAAVFTQQALHPSMDPRGVRVRESRDSEAHPASLAIVFALDVSGSMGEIPSRLARETLPGFVRALLDAGVLHPQVLFVGVGCANGDRAPLQVGQFESTETLMDQWLVRLWLEGGGGGGNESYELAMAFCARHTELDCVRKRGRRGFLFLTGDEPPNPLLSRSEVERVLGDRLEADVPIAQVVEEVQRTYEPFFLIPDPERARPIERAWRDLLGDRVIVMESPDDTAFVAAGAVALLEGAAPTVAALVDRLGRAGLARERAARVARTLEAFAASIGRDGNPGPRLGPPRLRDGGASGWER